MVKSHSIALRWAVREFAAVVLIVGGAAFAQDKASGDIYPLDTCPVSGEKLGGAMGAPVVFAFEGREIRLCCAGCKSKFEKESAKYLAQIDEAIVKQQTPLYPMAKCVVTPEEDAGKVNYVYKNRLVRFCCKDCIKDFNADPAKFLGQLDKAVIEKQKAAYPATTCVVSGKKIEDGKTVDFVTGNRLVRFCCSDCVAEFKKDPLKYLSKLDGTPKPAVAPAAK